MTKQIINKYFTVGGIMLIISSFMSIMATVNDYDAYINSNQSNVVAAFNG